MSRPRRAAPSLSIKAAITDFARDLRLDKSPKTIATYSEASRLYARHAAQQSITSVDGITTESIRAWLTSLRDAGRSPGTLFNRHSGLKAFLRWCVDEGQLPTNPMATIPIPKVEPPPIPLLSIMDLKSILRACSGPHFEDLRDTALIRLLIDTGMRRAECAALRGSYDPSEALQGDLDLDLDEVTVVGKGSRVRRLAFGARTARELRRYLRARHGHEHGHRPELWIGRRGPLNDNAILLVVRRRARAAGLTGRIFVHMLRHTWAHEALSSGMNESDVQRLGGWRDRDMLARYGASGAEQRARAAYRQHSLGDRL